LLDKVDEKSTKDFKEINNEIKEHPIINE